jgi:hypothetical protein
MEPPQVSLIAHQTTTSSACGHKSFLGEAYPKFAVRLGVPKLGDGLVFYVPYNVIVIVSTWRHIAIGINFCRCKDVVTRIEAKSGVMIGIVCF